MLNILVPMFQLNAVGRWLHKEEQIRKEHLSVDY
jgi:hypothetical protein